MENGNHNRYKTSALQEVKNEADLLPCRIINNGIQITPIRNNKTSILSYAGIAQGLWGDSAADSDNFIRNERE